MDSADKAIVKAWLDTVRAALGTKPIDRILVGLLSDQVDGTTAAAVIDELLGDRRTAAAGSGGGVPWFCNTKLLMQGFAIEAICRSAEDSASDFDRVWDELLDFVKHDEAESEALASVVGLWLSRPKLTFDQGGLYLAQLPDELAVERWSAPGGLAGHALGFYSPFVGNPWDLELHSQQRAVAEQKLNAAVERAWRALALIVPTNPTFPLPGTDYLTSIGPTWLGRSAGRSIVGGTSQVTMAHGPDAGTEDSWVATYHDIVGVDWDRFTFLDLAFRRFIEASRTKKYDDRLIGFSIAAESLFLVGSTLELSNRLAQRASVWLGGDATERDQHFKDFKEIYSARSKLVHGTSWKPKGSTRRIDVLANLAGEHMRRALRKAVDWCNSGHCKKPSTGLLDWDREFRHALILPELNSPQGQDESTS